MQPSPETEKTQLIKGLKQLKLHYTEKQTNQLLEYARLLQKWNQIHNLISAKDNQHIIKRHILDSLNLGSYLDTYYSNSNSNSTAISNGILDFGTGGGLPGLPLAILYPHHTFTLVDSNHKKTAFLHYCKTQLKLNNIKPLCQRIEENKNLYPLIITRAAGEITELIKCVVPQLNDNGIMLAMLGGKPTEENMKQIKHRIKKFRLDKLELDFNQGKRHILIVWKPSD